MTAFVFSGGIRRAQVSTAIPTASSRTRGRPSPRNEAVDRARRRAASVQGEKERQRRQPDERHAPFIRRRGHQRGQVGPDRPLAGQGRPQPRRTIAAIEEQQRARTDGHADRGGDAEKSQRPAPARQPGAREGDPRGQGKGEDRHQRAPGIGRAGTALPTTSARAERARPRPLRPAGIPRRAGGRDVPGRRARRGTRARTAGGRTSGRERAPPSRAAASRRHPGARRRRWRGARRRRRSRGSRRGSRQP